MTDALARPCQCEQGSERRMSAQDESSCNVRRADEPRRRRRYGVERRHRQSGGERHCREPDLAAKPSAAAGRSVLRQVPAVPKHVSVRVTGEGLTTQHRILTLERPLLYGAD